MTRQMLLPKLNEFGNDATVSGWMVSVGDSITIDMPVINMEMEKAEGEVCSTVAGKVIRQLVRKGDVVKVGQAILEVECNGFGRGRRSCAGIIESSRERAGRWGVAGPLRADCQDPALRIQDD